MKQIDWALLFVLVLFLNSCEHPSSDPSTEANDILSSKVDSLLSLMTVEEKVGQMNLYNGFWEVTGPAPQGGNAEKKYEHLRKGWVGAMLSVRGVEEVRAVQKIAVEESRLGIPLLIGFDVIHGYKTLSPIPLAEASSWDMEAIEKSASMAAKEATAAGINWTFAPMVDIGRDARWGRVMEGAGEDPFLGSRIAKARVKGFQGGDLADPHTMAACVKHFAGYGFAEAGKEYNTVEIGTSTLHNIVLPPFKAAVDAGARTLMNSFNELNGIPASGDHYLQRELLKDKWGFKGFVVSDWASIAELIPWGYAKDSTAAAELAAKAGSDMDMEGHIYVKELTQLVKEGRVPEAIVNEAAGRILRVKFELGLFDDPYRYCDSDREKELAGHQDHHEAALVMAKKSIVLLKNEGSILPLKKEGQKVVLIGQLAADDNSPLGSWRIASDDHSAVSVLEGMRKYTANQLGYEQGVEVFMGKNTFLKEVEINKKDRSGIDKAVRAARSADVVVMVLGEHGFQSGEGRSRTDLQLPGLQQEMLEAVYAVNKNVVLVLNNGRPLAIEWAAENVPAIVEAWHLGTQTGHAVAQVLYGDYNPSGKLPMSFPRNVGQVPIYYNHKNTGRPNMDAGGTVFWSHYTDVDKTPLFPFGHGLSYTTFEYSDLVLADDSVPIDGQVEVSVVITNSGRLEGREVAQLYLRDLVGSVSRPVRELKAFDMVNLQPGESKKVKFTLDQTKLGFFDNEGNYIVEAGDFEVFVGGSSTANLKASFSLN